MGAVSEGIQTNRTKPGRQQASVLARRHWLSPIDSAWEQRLSLMQDLLLQPAAYRLPGLLCDLELNGSARLPLHDRSSRSHSAIEGYIVDPKRNEVTSSQLAVEGEIEQSQVANALRHLEPDPNGPDLPGFERRFEADQLASVPRCDGAAGMVSDSILHCSAPETKPHNESWPFCRRNPDRAFLRESSSAYQGKSDVPFYAPIYSSCPPCGPSTFS